MHNIKTIRICEHVFMAGFISRWLFATTYNDNFEHCGYKTTKMVKIIIMMFTVNSF